MNKDGLSYPAIEELLSKIDSKYKLALAAARVAVIIEKNKLVVPSAKSVSPVGKALEEILADKVEMEFE